MALGTSFREVERVCNSAISEPMSQARRIGEADIVVGIPFYNEADTIGHVFETVKEGLERFYPKKKAVIICAGASAGADALEVVNNIPVAEESNIKRIAFLMRNEKTSGKGWSLRAIAKLASELRADVIIFEADLLSRRRDGDIEGLSPQWVRLLLEPIEKEGIDLVLPRFNHHYFDAPISAHLAYPLLASLYNLRVRSLAGGEVGISQKLLKVYLDEPSLWGSDVDNYGVDSWLITTAIVNEVKLCEANLGVKIHRPSPGKQPIVLRQIAKILFDQIAAHRDWWETRGQLLHSLPSFAPPKVHQPEEVRLDLQALIERYKKGFNKFYYPLYGKILPDEVCQRLERLAKSKPSEFIFPAKLWARIVYSFLFNFAFDQEFAQDDLLSALIPVYEGRVASFVNEMNALKNSMKTLPPEKAVSLAALEAERLIEEQVKEFIYQKPHFLKKWKQKKEERKPPLPKIIYREFVPGVALVVPQEVTAPSGEVVKADPIYRSILNRYRGEFEEFVHQRLGITAKASSVEIAQGIEGFMRQVEDDLDKLLLPGDLHTVAGTRRVAEEIFHRYPHQDTFALRPEVARWLLQVYPPANLLTKLGYTHLSGLFWQDYEPNDALALASWSEERDYIERIQDWIRDFARPEHFTRISLQPLVVSYDKFPSLAEMKEATALSRLMGRVVISNLRKGMGGEFPKLRYFTMMAKNIVEAERFGEVWQEFAEEKKEFGSKIVNSIEGHWGRDPLSGHNIFENKNHRILVERLRQMTREIAAKADKDPALLKLVERLKDMADFYHLALTLPDGRFIPCSAWTWASYSFKGGKGLPSPLSLHVERDWASREFLLKYVTALGGSEEEVDAKIMELMGERRESEDLTPLLLGVEKGEERILLEQVISREQPRVSELHRFEGNPILEPIKDHWWESKYVFNPGVVRIKDRIYILYRAMGDDDVSRIGLAISDDGFHIQERLPSPIFEPAVESEKTGCEDPRLTLLDDQIHMLYTAYSSIAAQIALASIKVEDLLNRRWEKWQRRGLAFPGFSNKNAILFPQKFKGKYVMYHRVFPSIWVSLLDHLGSPWPRRDSHKILLGPRSGLMWDGARIGAGAQPIKTRYGWLVIYHGADYAHVYRLGVLLVDLNDPRRLLYRSPNSILEPKERYEIGEKGKSNVCNVVFTCGAAPRVDKDMLDVDDEILVYYGAADSVIGVASGKISELIPEEVRVGRSGKGPRLEHP